MDCIIKYAKERNTEMGQRYAKGEEDLVSLNLEQLKKILFHNPNNKKFVITNFSTRLDDFQRFECEVCPIEKMIVASVPNPQLNNPHLQKLLDKEALEKTCNAVFGKYADNGIIGRSSFC